MPLISRCRSVCTGPSWQRGDVEPALQCTREWPASLTHESSAGQPVGTIFVIKSVTGWSIKEHSVHAEEQEVLFLAATQLQVVVCAVVSNVTRVFFCWVCTGF